MSDIASLVSDGGGVVLYEGRTGTGGAVELTLLPDSTPYRGPFLGGVTLAATSVANLTQSVSRKAKESLDSLSFALTAATTAFICFVYRFFCVG